MTHTIESSVDANVPVSTAYDQWTRFEEFPRFMEHVESVRQLDDKRLRWLVNLGDRVREFDTEIAEQVPDKCIAWRSTRGAPHAAVVTFHRLGDSKCRVMLRIEYERQGLLGSVVPVIDAQGDMKRFAELMEQRRAATGFWRFRILNERERHPDLEKEGS